MQMTSFNLCTMHSLQNGSVITYLQRETLMTKKSHWKCVTVFCQIEVAKMEHKGSTEDFSDFLMSELINNSGTV